MLTTEERAALAAYTPSPETIARVNRELAAYRDPVSPKGPPYLLVQPGGPGTHAIGAQLAGKLIPAVGDVADPRDPMAQPMGGAWDGSCTHGHPVRRTVNADPRSREHGWVIETPGACVQCPPGVIATYLPGAKPGR